MKVDALIFTDVVTGGFLWQRSIGAYRVATELRSMGLTVQVIDFWSFITVDGPELALSLIEKFCSSKTLFVGFSTTFMNTSVADALNKRPAPFSKVNAISHRGTNAFATDYSTLEAVKKFINSKYPRCDIVVGGARAAAHPDPIGNVRVTGYGEIHMRDYIAWKTGKNPLYVGKMEGKTSVFDYNPKATGFDFGKSQVVWEASDCVQPEETLPIEIARGCIFSCAFCAYPLNGKSKIDYLRESELLEQELLYNYENYGTTRYVVCDDTYNDSTEKLEWMQRIVEKLPFKFTFTTCARLDLIASKPEQVDLLYANGLRSVFFGIETLNHQAGKAIGKGMDPNRLVETLTALRAKWGNEVFTSSGFIAGLPFDTYAIMEKWFDTLMEPEFPLHYVNISPLIISAKNSKRIWNSKFEEDPEKYGYTDIRDGAWRNPRYGTSLEGCNVFVSERAYYLRRMGMNGLAGHMAFAAHDYGYDTEMQLCQDVRLSSSLPRLVYQRFVNYMDGITNL